MIFLFKTKEKNSGIVNLHCAALSLTQLPEGCPFKCIFFLLLSSLFLKIFLYFVAEYLLVRLVDCIKR